MPKFILFNSRDSLIRITIAKIAYFESDGNYTYLVSANKLRSCITMNLSHTELALAEQLGDMAHRFVRIGKRYIVNLSYIYQIDVLRQCLTLSDGESFVCQLSVSKEALKTLKALLTATAVRKQ